MGVGVWLMGVGVWFMAVVLKPPSGILCFCSVCDVVSLLVWHFRHRNDRRLGPDNDNNFST